MAAEGDVLSEIEVLQSIYLDELRVVTRDDGGWEVSLVLYPSTAEDSISQFVRLTLTLTLDSQYPASPPSISIHNPRGLSDDKLNSVQDCLKTEAESCLGSPVLYQLIEKAKEILTESNIPNGNCVICLYGFKDGEAFTKTSCYHYFHSHCLGRYIAHAEAELLEREKELEEDKTRERSEDELNVVCPVCREPLTYDVNQLLTSPAPCFPKLEGAVIGAEFRQKWRKFQKLLERQKAKGGIIDPEAESNRFLIHINEPPPDPENTSTEVDVSPSQSLPSPTAPTNPVRVSQDQMQSGYSHRRGHPGHRRQALSKGSRRGGGGRPLHGRPVHLTEHLDKLSLSPENQGPPHAPARCCDAPTKARLQQEVAVSSDGESVSRPNPDIPKTDGQRDALDSERGRGIRGRRRGPRGSAQHPGQWQERHWRGTDQWDAPGGTYHRWDGRGQRSGGGANNPRSRGGDARRGNGKVFHQRVAEGEVGREEVL